MTRKLSAVAAVIHQRLQARAVEISGTIGNHRRIVGNDWIVSSDVSSNHRVRVEANADGGIARFEDNEALTVSTSWLPGMTLGLFKVDGEVLAFKVDLTVLAIRLRLQGVDGLFRVRSTRVAELAQLMPEKLPPDTSKL